MEMVSVAISFECCSCLLSVFFPASSLLHPYMRSVRSVEERLLAFVWKRTDTGEGWGEVRWIAKAFLRKGPAGWSTTRAGAGGRAGSCWWVVQITKREAKSMEKPNQGATEEQYTYILHTGWYPEHNLAVGIPNSTVKRKQFHSKTSGKIRFHPLF